MYWRGYSLSSLGAGAEYGRDIAAMMLHYLHTKCPNSRFIISGWSQGAWIASGTVRTIGRQDYEDSIAGIILISDPNGSNMGGTVIDPVQNTAWAGGTGVSKVAADAAAAAAIHNPFVLPAAAVPFFFPVSAPLRMDDHADHTIQICIPGDIICDALGSVPTYVNGEVAGDVIHYVGYGSWKAYSKSGAVDAFNDLYELDDTPDKLKFGLSETYGVATKLLWKKDPIRQKILEVIR